MISQKTEDLKSSIIALINRTTPVKGKDGRTLTIEDIKFNIPDSVDDIDKQLEMKYKKDGSMEGYISGRMVIKDSAGKVINKSNNIKKLIPVPIINERGTYLVNGTEKHVLNQMRLKPGTYTSRSQGTSDVKTNIMIDNSGMSGKYIPQITIIYSPSKNEFKFRVKGRKNYEFNGINFLRAIGFKDPDISKMLGNGNISDQLFEKYGNRSSKTINDIYLAIVGNRPPIGTTPNKLKGELFSFLQDNAKFGTGIPVVQANLGLKEDYLSPKVIAGAVTKTFSVFRNEVEEDDKDDLRFKDVYDDNDFIYEQIEKDWMSFINRAQEIVDSDRKDIRYTDIRPATKIGQSLNQFMSTSSLVQTPEETNPLFIASLGRKITQLGDGGLSTQAAQNEFSARNLALNSVNRIDPIETPESGNIGLVEHLTQGAVIDKRTIKIPVLKVRNGIAKSIKSNEVFLTPDEEYRKTVAFNDSRYVARDGSTFSFTKSEVPARRLGKIINVPVSQVDYIDKNPQSVMGYAANMIPFVAHNDGNRALMGSNMQKQAINIKNREAPLVATIMDPKNNMTYDEFIGEEYGRPVRADVDGVVEKIDKGKITIKDSEGNSHIKPFYEYYPLNQSFINNDVLVKPGDEVKKGEMIAEGWQTKGGKLALGLNAKVAYLPYKGYNYEDGIVISKSFAKRMSTDEMEEQTIEIPKLSKGGRGSKLRDELISYTRNPDVRNKLDIDGIIKVGQQVRPGSVLVATLKPALRDDSDDLEEAILAADKNVNYRYEPIKIDNSSYVEGTVKRVTVIDSPDGVNKQKIIITLVSSKPLKTGDKISGRHGNKGTITKIIDDDEMPVAEDGKEIDLMFSPLAVPSRKNIGQLFEVNAGLIADKTGKPYNVMNFDHEEKNKVIQKLKEIGYEDGKMKVTLKEKNPDGSIKDIPIENPITVGNMYIMKLKHKVDDKIQARSNLETSPSRKTNMPAKVLGASKGEKSNPQSLGEMEMRALQGHQAVWNLLENSTVKSDGGGDLAQRIAVFNAISTGKLDSLDMPATPESLNVMRDTLKVLGLNVKPIQDGKEVDTFDDAFDSLALQPMKSSEFIKMVGRDAEVKEAKLYTAKDVHGEVSKAKGAKLPTEDVPVKGGLADPKIFGEKDTPDERTKWGYVKLAVPLPNPVLMQNTSYNPYSLLTGIGSTKLQELSKGKKVMIIDPDKYAPFDDMDPSVREKHKKDMEEAGLTPGELVSPADIEKLNAEGKYILWKAGGEALQGILDKIDIKKELVKAKRELDEAQGADIDKSYKKFKLLTSLSNNKMEASDLMMRYVPVAPSYLRPVLQTDDKKDYIIDDLNKLYGGLISANNPVKADTDMADLYQTRDVTTAAMGVGNIYNKLTNLTGHATRRDIKTKRELKGIKDSLSGKEGLIRGQMLSKRVDFSGRSVIGVDPGLKMNEVGIPMDMAKQLYKPFVIKELIDQGFAGNTFEANKKWKSLDEDTKHVIKVIAKDRPVIPNRQPSLHKFSIMALDPIIEDTEDGEVVRSIRLNPFVVEGFNADFDGDTMAVHVPVTERAKEEAKKLMLPSENLINPTDGKMIVSIRHEMALGIYYLTIKADKAEGNGIVYSDHKKLRQDYKDGLVNARTKVSIGSAKDVTAGQAMFNILIPEKYRDYKKVWSKGELEEMFKQMYQDAEESNWKNMSKLKISSVIDSVKDLGFESSTRSGISIGTNDFKKLDNAQEIYSRHVDSAKKEMGDNEEAAIEGWRNAEKEIESELKKGNILDEDNPLQIMMASGARAKPDQIRRMMATVGVGMDINKNLVSPIESSHFDGLSPEEYWTHGKDSRKGMSDRSVSTREPGRLTREVWSSVQDVVVIEKDCGTRDGVDMMSSNKGIEGRIAADDVVGENGTLYVRKNKMITKDIRNKIYKDNTTKRVKVRSTLKCKSVGGVCQYCYGAMPGTMQLPKEGTPVGILASQAMGEPVTQMTMNTFHGGGTSSSATLGLPRVESILNMGKDRTNPAILSRVSGTVERIDVGVVQDTVYIGGKAHVVPHMDNKSQKLKISVGDTVVKGDFLTYGDTEDITNIGNDNMLFTNADPRELYKLKSDELNQDVARDYVQDYLTNSMDYAFVKTTGDGTIDRRHIETIIGKMTSKARVMDSGDSNFIKGEQVDRNAIIGWNAENAALHNAKKVPINNMGSIVGRKSADTYKGKDGKVIIAEGEVINNMTHAALVIAGHKNIKVHPKQIVYENQLHSKSTIAENGHDNWFSNLGHKSVMNQLARGATLGQVDKLEDPRAQSMSGKLLRIGEGFNIADKIRNTISSKMFNLFSKKE